MGSFGGHIFPGSIFLIFALRCVYLSFDRYFRLMMCKQNDKKVSFHCTATYKCVCCRRKPAEGYLKIILTTIGMIVELLGAFQNEKFTHFGNLQHITMYFFFFLNGLVDVTVFYNPNVPPGSDYIAMALAFFIEGLLFYFHLHGRVMLDIVLHQLLLIAIFASCASCLIEMKYSRSFLSVLFRCLCGLQQGTWFYQVGFILYNPFPGAPKWEAENHNEIMLVTAMFCWHIIGNLILMAFIGFIVWLLKVRIQYRTTKMNTGIDNYSDEVHETKIIMESLLSKKEEEEDNQCYVSNKIGHNLVIL